MADLPSHISPMTSPTTSPRPVPVHSFSQLDTNDHRQTSSQLDRRRISNASTATHDSYDDDGAPPPPSIISPAFTPPSTPGISTPTPHHLRQAKSVPVDSDTITSPPPKLVEQLPEVNCVVRARIPTTTGQEMFLHLYTNNVDNKEHLAIVFGPYIRSRSLDAPRKGETEMDRMIRGAYTGRLYPGRTSSKNEVLAAQAREQAPQGKQTSNTQTEARLEKDIANAATSTEKSSSSAKQQPTVEQEDPLPTSQPSASASASRPTAPTPPQSTPPTIDILRIPPLVRIHSECYTGETVWSARCDCGEQLDEAARLMSLSPLSSSSSSTTSRTSQAANRTNPAANLNPGGVIIYLRQEGRGIGLSEKLKAYNLQDLGNDTVEANLLLRHPADARSYGLATAMLLDLGLGGDRGIRLLTNNPEKVRAVEGPGREVRVRERVAMVPVAWRTGGREGVRSTEVDQYLRTKIEKMSHILQLNEGS